MSLVTKTCVPCEGGVPPLSRTDAEIYLKEVPGWELASDGKSISRTLKFKNFKEAMACVNKVAELAESEGHHPDINLFGWNQLTLTLATHATGGLSENDFIVAAKINEFELGIMDRV